MTAGIYVARTFLNPILGSLVDPEKEKQEQARQHAKAHLERLNRRQRLREDTDEDSTDTRSGQRVEELRLNEYENLIALEMVAPEDIPVGFDGKPLFSVSNLGGWTLTPESLDRHWRFGSYHRGN
jgi:ATPase family AAA domain-containing protein 1